MLMKTKLYSFIFAIVYIIQLFAETSENVPLRNFSKPLIVITLLMWLYSATKLRGKFHKRIFTGLIFAFTGDVLLMLQDGKTSFFIYGLVAFLLCHIFYINVICYSFGVKRFFLVHISENLGAAFSPVAFSQD